MNFTILQLSNETILATKLEFFFTKAATVQRITDVLLLGFSLILLPGMFISYYTIIYFFVNNFFFECLYFSEYDIQIFECSYLSFGWEIDHSLSMYVNKAMEGSSKIFTDAYRGRGVLCFMCIYALVLSLHVFVLWCRFICKNLTLSSFKKGVFVRNGYVSPMILISVTIKQGFFNFKLLFWTKVCQNGFNFNQIES